MRKTRYRRVALAASLILPIAGCNFLPWHKDVSAATPVAEVAPATRPATTQPTTRHAPSQVQADLRKIVTYLASDSLQGRGIDTPGLEAAAQYIRNKFVAAGLRPLPGLGGYYQDFDYTTVAGISEGTKLTSSASESPYELHKDYTVLSSAAEKAFSGPVVFAGYGIASEEDQYDDFANVDVKGKVCLILRFEPHNEKGESRFGKGGYSANAHLRNKFNACAAHGASAVVLVNPPNYRPAGDILLPFATAYQDGHSPIPVLQVTQKVAEAWLKQANAPTLSALQQKIDSSGKPASQALPNVTAGGNVALDRTTHKLHNVISYLPGAGPLADEYVVVGAHYDHLGLGGPGSLAPGSHEIHHGADDNASGTSAVVTLATQLAADPEFSPSAGDDSRRSLVFVTFSAEESGLIGSSQFVEHPPVPLEKVAAMLNMDMVGRVKNDTLYIGGAGTAAPFDGFVKRAEGHSPLEFKEFGRGGFGPSDHMSFAAKKVPVLFLFSGMHADYHRPTDTADKINYAGLADVVGVARELTTDLATMPKSPYLASADGANPHMSGMGGGGPHVTLGVIPDYGTDITRGGVRITGTSPNTPAAKAGLQDGDVIVGFGAKKIDNLYDLTDALAAGKAGDKITIKFLRAGKETAVDVTLAERGG